MSDLRRLNSRTVAIVLSIALVIVVFNALTTGAYTIRFGEVFTVLFQGPAKTSGANSISHAVFWNVRLPRVALAIVVGASLALRHPRQQVRRQRRSPRRHAVSAHSKRRRD